MQIDAGGCNASGTSPVEPHLESLSQRELRNESGRALRALRESQSFILTNRGVPAGRILPLDTPHAAFLSVRAAKRVGGRAALVPQRFPFPLRPGHICGRWRATDRTRDRGRTRDRW